MAFPSRSSSASPGDSSSAFSGICAALASSHAQRHGSRTARSLKSRPLPLRDMRVRRPPRPGGSWLTCDRGDPEAFVVLQPEPGWALPGRCRRAASSTPPRITSTGIGLDEFVDQLRLAVHIQRPGHRRVGRCRPFDPRRDIRRTGGGASNGCDTALWLGKLRQRASEGTHHFRRRRSLLATSTVASTTSLSESHRTLPMCSSPYLRPLQETEGQDEGQAHLVATGERGDVCCGSPGSC